MYATLKENCTHEGFTPEKEYKYFDNYEIENGKVFFYFVANDEGKKVKMNYLQCQRIERNKCESNMIFLGFVYYKKAHFGEYNPGIS